MCNAICASKSHLWCCNIHLGVQPQAPLYPDKAEIFRNSTFVVGYDTAIRLVMPKYYDGHDGMLLQLASMTYLGCSVLVAGRAVTDDQGNSSFKTFEDVEVPQALTKLVGLSLLNASHAMLPKRLCNIC